MTIEIMRSAITVNEDQTIDVDGELEPCAGETASLDRALEIASGYALVDSGFIFSVWKNDELMAEFYNKVHYRLQQY